MARNTKPTEPRECPACGREFLVSKWNGKKRYCSRECQTRAASQRQYVQFKEALAAVKRSAG
ncbi:MAG: hypothetical protein HYT87_15690 [Nitrospirae bacterium]|nr:hypothetical protein [Nitrospirota bacterium]